MSIVYSLYILMGVKSLCIQCFWLHFVQILCCDSA